MKSNYFISFIIFLSTVIHAQNLVPNGSFERSFKPTKSKYAGNIEWASPWFSAGKGSPDLISNNDVPYGRQSASDGNQFAGIILYDADNAEFREYLEVKLIRPLEPGEDICLRMKISAADDCRFFTDALGFALSNDSIRVNNWNTINRDPELRMRQFSAISDTGATWQSLEMKYSPKGGEQYLTIGNFRNDASIALQPNNKIAFLRLAYIYIDQVYIGSCIEKSKASNQEILPISANSANYEELPASKLHVPNVLTPNGDGFNDVFYIVGLAKYSTLKITTKKGEEIFSTKNYKNDWDGHDTPTGNYRYELVLPDGNVISGPLDIVRKKK